MSPASRVQPQTLLQLPRPGQNPAYRAWVRKQPCCVCQANWGIEFAHTGPRGLRQKANDLDGIPLCRKHHQWGKGSYHALGRVRFEAYHQISIQDVIASLNRNAQVCGIDLWPVPRKPMDWAGRIGRRKRA